MSSTAAAPSHTVDDTGHRDKHAVPAQPEAATDPKPSLPPVAGAQLRDRALGELLLLAAALGARSSSVNRGRLVAAMMSPPVVRSGRPPSRRRRPADAVVAVVPKPCHVNRIVAPLSRTLEFSGASKRSRCSG
jgi:hypothetical protein